MTTVETTQVRDRFPELLTRVGDCATRTLRERGERVVIEKEGQAVAAIIGYADLKRLEAMDSAKDSAILRRLVAENQEFVTLEEVIAGYNALHNTEFDVKNIINE